MNRLILILAGVFTVTATCRAADQIVLPERGATFTVSTNASSGTAMTNSSPISGRLCGILLDVGGASSLAATNGAEVSLPDITGAYTVNGTYASSNKYTRDAGTYVMFYTNAAWYISTNAGYLAGALWSNKTQTVLGLYTAAVASVSGQVSVVAGYVSMSVAVETVDPVLPRTLLSVTGLSADTWYLNTNASGLADQPLAGERVRVHAYGAWGTNSTLKSRVLFCEE